LGAEGKNVAMKKSVFVISLALASLCFLGSPGITSASLFTADGSVLETSSLTVTIQNGTSLTGTSSGSTTFNFPQYLKVDYYSNQSGYQAVIIFTDNSSAGANPKYTGGGDGAGMVLTTSTAVNVPMHWVVFPTAQTGGYNFDPIDPANEFFVVDKKRPDGSAFPAGFASFIFDLQQRLASLAAAPIANRTTNSGTVYIYLAANFQGAPTGTYKTNQLNIQLVTLVNGSITAVHQSQVFTATVTRS